MPGGGTPRPLPSLLAECERPRVAVVRALRMGDFLLGVPALRSLRAALPHAEITYVGLGLTKPLAARFPHYIDQFWEFPGFPGIAEPLWSPARLPALMDFVRRAHGHGFDLAVQMHGSGVFSNPFTLMLGARYAAGYRRDENDHFGLDFTLSYPYGAHEIDVNLRLATAMGAPDRGRALEFPVQPEDTAAAKRLLPPGWLDDGRPLVGLHPGAKVTARRWPARYFATVGDAVAEEFGARVVVTGEQAEGSIAAEVVGRMRAPACNLAGGTSVGALAGLLTLLNCFVSNDTGPAHLANALGVANVTIFGPATPAVWASQEPGRQAVVYQPVPCSPCGHAECPVPGHPCLEQVRPEVVLARVREALALSRRSSTVTPWYQTTPISSRAARRSAS